MERVKFGRTFLALTGAAFAVASGASAQTRVYPTDLTNIALAANGGRVLSSTSTLDDDPNFNASNLIDGQVYNPASKTGSSGWASNRFDPVNMDYVTIGFTGNQLKRIGKIAINPGSAVAPERWAKDIEVQVSTDSAEGPFKAVAQVTLKRSAERQEFVILPAEARFVRLMFRSNWGSDRAVALGEVELFEAIDQTDAMGGVIGRLESAIKDLQQFKQTQSEIQNNTGARSAATRNTAPSLVRTAVDTSGVRQVQARSGVSAGGNIALASNGGKVVDVSSVFNDDPLYAAEKLIDGQIYSLADDKGSFGWASQGFAPNRQWVTLGFRDDRTRLISKIIINPTSNQSTPRWASRVDVQVTTGSPKDGPFRTVGTFNIRQEAVNQDFEVRPVEAKYVRFNFTANGPGNPSPLGDPSVSSDRSVSLGEIEIYEPVASSGDLEALISRFNQVLIDLKRLRGQNPTMNTTAFSEPLSTRVQTVASAQTAISRKPVRSNKLTSSKKAPVKAKKKTR